MKTYVRLVIFLTGGMLAACFFIVLLAAVVYLFEVEKDPMLVAINTVMVFVIGGVFAIQESRWGGGGTGPV